MNANKKRIIAVICLLVFVVGVFVACKKSETKEKIVSVSTDENGSLYYTDPTFEVDGFEYGGETHFVKPEETNQNGEYTIGTVTSKSYTTDDEGNLGPVTYNNDTNTTNEPGTTKSGGGSSETTTKPTSSSTTDNTSTSTNPDTSETESNTEAETSELHGIDSVVDNNKLSNDGVIEAW